MEITGLNDIIVWMYDKDGKVITDPLSRLIFAELNVNEFHSSEELHYTYRILVGLFY